MSNICLSFIKSTLLPDFVACPFHFHLYKLFIIFVLILSFLAGCGKQYKVVRTHQKTENREKAESFLDEKSSDVSDDRYFNDGLILYRQGQNKRARIQFEKSINFYQKNWLAYYYLGLIMSKEGVYPKAILQFNQSLKYAPGEKRSRSLIYVAIGESWEYQGEYGKATQNYQMALNLYPESVAAKEGLNRVAELSKF